MRKDTNTHRHSILHKVNIMTSIHHIHNLDIPSHQVQVVPQPFSINLCQLIGRAFIEFTTARKVVIAHSQNDIDKSVLSAFVKGLNEQGANIIDIGHSNEEQLYFALRHFNADAGAFIGEVHVNDVLALRNFTFLNEKAQLISQTNGLHTIWSLAQQHGFNNAAVPGSYQQQDIAQHYLMNIMSILHCLSPQPLHKIEPLKAIIYCHQQATKTLVEHLNTLLAVNRVDIELIEFKPILSAQHANSLDSEMTKQIAQHQADIGIILNKDNSCQLFDQAGQFIAHHQVSQIIGLLLEDKYANATLVNDNSYPCQTLNHSQIELNNQAVQRTMCNSNAIYGASNTGNHFFQHTGFAPSVLLPWLFTLFAQVKFNQNLGTLTSLLSDQQSVQVANQQQSQSLQSLTA